MTVPPALGRDGLGGRFGDGAVRHFSGFHYDPARHEFRDSGGRAIPLRPKVEALLRHLLVHAGVVVSRDELMSAVWPGIVVTDDSLVKAVAELRAALNDGGQRLLRTVARRGYLLDVEPRIADAAAAVPNASSTVVQLRTEPRSAAPPSIDAEFIARHTYAVVAFAEPGDDEAKRRTADRLLTALTAAIGSYWGGQVLGQPLTAKVGTAAAARLSAARRLGARYVLSGRIDTDSDGKLTQVDLQITSIDDGVVIWSARFEDGQASDLLPARPLVPERLALVVTSRLRSHFSEFDGRRADRLSHPSGAELVMMGWRDMDRWQTLDDVRRARERFRAALRLDSRSIFALSGISAAYVAERLSPAGCLGDSDIAEGERAMAQVFALDPNNAGVTFHWTALQIRRGNADIALPAILRILKTHPGNSMGWVYLARLRLSLAQLDQVLPAVMQVLELAEGNVLQTGEACSVAAEAALMRDAFDEAADWARRAIALRPSFSRPYGLLAATLALLGQDAQAASAIRELRRLETPDVLARTDFFPYLHHPDFARRRAGLEEALRCAGLQIRSIGTAA